VRAVKNDRRPDDAGAGSPTAAPPETPPAPETPAAPGGLLDAGASGKLSKKQKKLQKDAHRPLDSWERYRALTDALDEAIDLVDLADHKARFALVIMAAVNVVLFLSADALDPLKAKSATLQIMLGIYLFLYVLVALFFFLQAIESLRPRHSQPQVNPADQMRFEEYPLGIRFYEDVLRRDVNEYVKAWQDVRIGQLNSELAIQAHALAAINRAKYAALGRLYKGLLIMTIMGVGLVALAGLAQVVGTAKKAKETLSRGEEILGTTQRITDTGVKEPSGAAFHPGLGHVFVVGDDGTLAELDGFGKNVRTIRVEQQIEDVVYHPPSRALLMISESKSELILFDPVAGKEKGRFKLDATALLGAPATGKNQGFEGIAFRPDPARPGGGIVYLAHQREPAVVVGIVFAPAPGATIGNESVVSRWTIADYDDLTAIAWVPSIDRLVVISDSKDDLLVLGPDGSVESTVPIPGEQQEGLAFDAGGNLWIADDKDKSVLRLHAALAGLEAHLKAATAGPLPAGEPAVPGGLIEKKKDQLLN
jgi:uncharacterized protein YjiK